MNERPMGGHVSDWRGFDPHWSDLQYQTILVAAECEQVAEQLAELRQRVHDALDLAATPCELASDEEVHFVFRLKEHGWSQAYCYYHPISQEDAQQISQRLETRVLFYGSYDEGRVFDLYDRGVLHESLNQGGEPLIYAGPRGEADLQKRLAAGWRISLKPMVQFYSLRDRPLKLESLKECNAVFDLLLRELEIFVAYYPWWFDERAQRVELAGSWRPDDFAEVRVLYGHRVADRNLPNVQLSLETDSAEIQFLRKLIESDGEFDDILTSRERDDEEG